MYKQISHQLLDWKFNFKEGGLSPSATIDKMAEDCKLFRPPTMIFGDNECLIRQPNNKFSLKFNAQESLKYINHELRKQSYSGLNDEPRANSICYVPQKLFIKHAQKWKNIQSPSDIQICTINESSDCFFITPFKGWIQGEVKIQRVKENVIPVAKLGPQNPIQFYHQGSMYQDELDDNGLIVYDYKFRSMKSSFFALIRCYARIDEVAVLILDTRLYWEEGWKKVARQFMVKKNTYAELKHKEFDFKNGWNMDPNQSHKIYSYLDEQLTENQYIHFG